MFNNEKFYANNQPSDSLSECWFDLHNEVKQRVVPFSVRLRLSLARCWRLVLRGNSLIARPLSHPSRTGSR